VASRVAAGRDGFTAEIVVWGLRDIDRALKSVAPDLRRELYARVGSAAKEVQQAAQFKAPGSIAAAIKLRRGGGRTGKSAFGFRLVSESAASAILEFAGSVSSGHTPQGTSLIQTLDSRYGRTGRFVWQAMDENKSGVESAVDEAVRDVTKQLQDRVNAAGRVAS
jgi:hypothetical protein